MNESYSRMPGGRLQFFPSVIKWLVIVNVVIYLLDQMILPQMIVPLESSTTTIPYLSFYGGLWALGSPYFLPFQFLTYMFLHANFMHLLLNMFFLWMVGMEVANIWGTKRFLIFYVLAGLGGGLFHIILSMILGQEFGYLIGASGSVFGVLIAFAAMFPDRMVLVAFFVPMKAKWFAALYIAIEVYQGFAAHPDDPVSHFGHIGGALVGFILVKTGFHSYLANRFSGQKNVPNNDGPAITYTPPAQRTPVSRADQRQSAKVIDARFHDIPKPRNAPVSLNFGDNQERIDEILDKISSQGYQSLTQEEKDLLSSLGDRKSE